MIALPKIKNGILTALFLFLGIYNAYSQPYSIKIDSLTNAYIGQVPKDVQRKFKTILNHRDSVNYYPRVDSIKYDYAFIEERFCEADTTIYTYERYFLDADYKINFYKSPKDSLVNIPRYSYYNGIKYASEYSYYSNSVAGVVFDNIYEYYYTLDTLLGNYKNLDAIQKLTYDSTLATFNASDTIPSKKSELEYQHNQKLLSTYQILTFIDHRQKKVLVSIQLPPTHPNVEIRYVNCVYYDW